jgi:hypothetical protein
MNNSLKELETERKHSMVSKVILRNRIRGKKVGFLS